MKENRNLLLPCKKGGKKFLKGKKYKGKKVANIKERQKKKKKKKKGLAEGSVSPIAAVHKRSKERIDNSDINSITKRKTRTSLGKHRQCIKFDKIC